jgi:hypothetical protein
MKRQLSSKGDSDRRDKLGDRRKTNQALELNDEAQYLCDLTPRAFALVSKTVPHS